MAFAKLKNVKLVYPRFYEPNEDGKYSVVVMIPRGSEAEKAFQAALLSAWSAGRDKFGDKKYCQNPTGAQLYAKAYIKIAGGLDSKGNPIPDWYDGHIGFNASSKKAVPVIDKTGAPIAKGDARLFSGALANVTLDVAPVEGSGNYCIGRYLRCVMVIDGGEPMAIGDSAPINAASDFADEIESAPGNPASVFDAFDDVIPY